MKSQIITLISILVIGITALFIGLNTPVAAQSYVERGVQSARGEGQPAELFGDTGIITSVTNTLLFIVGALAVIMIIWGGIRYAVSGGNASAVTAAKNTILYALVGLIIAFLAFAAVNWVLSIFSGGSSGFTNV